MNASAQPITQVSLQADTVVHTLNYLATRPYQEVVDLITAIKSQADASAFAQMHAADKQQAESSQPAAGSSQS